MPKFTFDASSSGGSCVPFIYGGCGGTENLFDSGVECEAICAGTQFNTAYSIARGSENLPTFYYILLYLAP